MKNDFFDSKILMSYKDESQTILFSNRNMFDGVVVANELVDFARRNKKDMFVFKVDFEKTFDSVSWKYLYVFMRMKF